ncbi:hypothetical protein RJ639_023552 [Escallonia herrerae]|uniref:Glycosyltransferase n=1 Tax=Escallonia herrerae TaxID=1293975 RepID=A0AA89AEI3_9ASTE|nr:hypothetical protein RJ639_023552 [Escallonia herrerae]
MDHKAELPPHVLIFPFPAQGHVNAMLKLAELLCLGGLHVTFLITPGIHRRLLLHANVQSRFETYTGFRFESLPEELPGGNPHSADRLMQLYYALNIAAKPFLRRFLVSSRLGDDSRRRPVTCIIADGILSLALEIAQDVGTPIIFFRTISACAFWSYFCIPELIKAGELPLNGDDMDALVANVRGMEGFLRRRDLPSFCRIADLGGHDFQMVLNETQQTPRAQGLILNTFEDLEAPILSQIRTACPKLYTIGPLHSHLKARLREKRKLQSTSSNSLLQEDRSCLRWLDEQPPKSVIYVSFGSIAIMTPDQRMEFWHGLVNSGKRFLWVIRPDSVPGKDGEQHGSTELEKGTKERGYMVGWAPQEEVLAHPAIGGFLTHSGWNSTLESIVEGVPMICWPYFADQQINSRFVGEVWKLGEDMKDTCDRVTVEKMVNELMDVKKDHFTKSADEMANLAAKSLSEGGSSYSNLDRLIQDITLMVVAS